MNFRAAAVLGVALAGPLAPHSQTPNSPETKMTEARGAFEVKITPRTAAAPEGLSAMSLEKTYTGALQAKSSGEMLSAGDPAKGNAGYVALERVTGTLDGHGGSFALMQSATMATGTPPQMTVTIVPGSGTGELSGIYGSMTILIAGGKHSYILSYAFAR